MLTTNASKRRIVRLSDETGEIELKLWGDKANLIHAANETVIITCVGVDVYMSKVSLNTTMSTTIQVFSTPSRFHCLVLAFLLIL